MCLSERSSHNQSVREEGLLFISEWEPCSALPPGSVSSCLRGSIRGYRASSAPWGQARCSGLRGLNDLEPRAGGALP